MDRKIDCFLCDVALYLNPNLNLWNCYRTRRESLESEWFAIWYRLKSLQNILRTFAFGNPRSTGKCWWCVIIWSECWHRQRSVYFQAAQHWSSTKKHRCNVTVILKDLSDTLGTSWTGFCTCTNYCANNEWIHAGLS